MKIIKERIVKYYVVPKEDANTIHGGPFDSRSEAMKCLKAHRTGQKEEARAEKLRVKMAETSQKEEARAEKLRVRLAASEARSAAAAGSAATPP